MAQQMTWGGQLSSCDLWIGLNADNRREIKTTSEYRAKIERGMSQLGKAPEDSFHPAMLASVK